MNRHCYVRVAGFNLTVVPRAPFQIRCDDRESGTLEVEHASANGRRFARLITNNGGYSFEIGETCASLADLLEVEPGPGIGHWQIETSLFTCCWPHGYALCSNNYPADPGPFDLLGPNNEMIFIQHPQRLPNVTEMRAPNQTVINIERTSASESIELEYYHDGHRWRQRHTVVLLGNRRIAITTQAMSRFAAAAYEAGSTVLQSLIQRPER